MTAHPRHSTTPLGGPRICPLCEACCGLRFDLDGRTVTGVTANPADLLSAGHSCAKGLGLGAVESDPSRLRTPLLRDAGGTLRPASWAEAFAEIGRRLPGYLPDPGNGTPGGCAVYSGNPAAHHLDTTFYLGELIAALNTRNIYSPASVDTWPKNLAHLLLYGTGLGMSIPDVDHTGYLLLLGSNPLVSNGSTLTAPGMARRLRELRARGGTLAVVDPIRTSTAEVADQHVPILPGTDALFLLGLLSVIARERLDSLGCAGGDAAPFVDGVGEVLAMAAEFPPKVVAPLCGIDPETIVVIARGFATAGAAAAHSRIGTCMQEFGTLANWLVEVLNIVTGNLDRRGGVMFPLPAAGGPNTWPPGRTPTLQYDRWRSRVRGLPERMGELPSVCFAEEILTPGPGQTRALIVIAGNPARSLANSEAVETALRALEFMVAVDCYVNETTRHADVILPPPSLLTRGHHDVMLSHFQVRNVARYSRPLLDTEAGEMAEWQILLRLSAIAKGTPDRAIDELDDEVAATAIRRAAALAECEPDTVRAAVAGRTGPQRLLDLRLRSGPHGDRFGQHPGGLTLAVLEDTPDGVDFGPMMPRLPEVLRTPNRRINLLPPMFAEDLARLRAGMGRPAAGLTMISRRQRRGMNSWLHNALAQPSGQCLLMMNPADAAELRLLDGDYVRVSAGPRSLTVELRVTDQVRIGVVSLPHGWGHDGPGLGIRTAAARPGANYNALVDDQSDLDRLTASPTFSGLRVQVGRA